MTCGQKKMFTLFSKKKKQKRRSIWKSVKNKITNDLIGICKRSASESERKHSYYTQIPMQRSLLPWCGQVGKNQHFSHSTEQCSCLQVSCIQKYLLPWPVAILVACFSNDFDSFALLTMQPHPMNPYDDDDDGDEEGKNKKNHLKNLQNSREVLNFLWIRSCIFVIIAIYSWRRQAPRMQQRKKIANFILSCKYDCIRTYFQSMNMPIHILMCNRSKWFGVLWKITDFQRLISWNITCRRNLLTNIHFCFVVKRQFGTGITLAQSTRRWKMCLYKHACWCSWCIHI